MTVELTVAELAAVVGAAVVLSATDAAAISRLGVAFVAQRLGVEPGAIRSYDAATDGGSDDERPTD